MKVALWGYGGYGRKLHHLLNSVWADKYEVVALFDRAYETRMERAGRQIIVDCPEKMKARYEAGEFEGVFIAARGAKGRYNDMAIQAELWGIPVLTIVSDSVLVPANEIEWVDDCEFGEVDDGYTLTACHDVYAFLEESGSQDLFIYHDGAGHIVRDTWFEDDVKWDPLSLNIPQRIDQAPSCYETFAGEFCAVNRFWGTNYWHFTFEILDQISVMESAGFKGTYVLARTEFAQAILEMAGIDSQRILWIDDLDKSISYRFEKMFFVHTDGFTFHGNHASIPLLRFAEMIGKSIDKNYNLGELPERIFVKRIGSRKLVGADQVLENHGFVPIVPEGLSTEEQIAHFRAANIVLTPHGANSANSLYMKTGSVFIETFGQGWGYPMCVNPLFHKGVHYLPVTGGFELSDAQHDGSADYSVDTTFLEMAIRNATYLAMQKNSVSRE